MKEETKKELIHGIKEELGEEFEVFSELNKQKILAKVEYQVINAEKDRIRLGEMPHEKLLDLAVVYRVLLSEDEENISFAVTHSFCETYGISREELAAAAEENMENRGFRIQTMEELLTEILGMRKEGLKGLIPMYMISNQNQHNGAAAMLCGRLFETLAVKLETDLYVLPSSIDEIIVIPVIGHDTAELKNIVESINDREVPENMVLSDNMYRCSRETGQLAIA